MALPRIKNVTESLDIRDVAGRGYNTHAPDFAVLDNQLTGGQNMDIEGTSPSKRLGHTLEGNYLGPTTGILGLIAHEPQGGTAEFLSVYDTGVYREVAGVWTALTSVTMTTNLRADSAYYPLTSKTYITNGTDSVVKYTSGTSGDQSDGSFKKGKYIVHFKNRLLVANVATQTDYVWYTDLGVDTFSANNYLRCEGEVTGMEVLYDKWLTFTKRKIYRTQNFTFNGVAAGPESFIPLPTDFGAIYDRTIKKVGDLVFFIGQDPEGIAAVYATDGFNTRIVSSDISPDLAAIAPASLTNACAASWGRFYRFSITPTGETTNTKEYLYDTVERRWLPPYTNTLGGFSCYQTSETSGQTFLYAGTQGQGQVFKLNQEDYDETPDEVFTTVGAVDGAIDGNPAKRMAQSFKLTSYTAQQTVNITSAYVRLKKNAGTTTGLTVRIETDNAGKPSGTLADAAGTTTIAAITSTSYAYYEAAFSNLSLVGNTTYWLVVKHTTEGSGNSQYYWSGHATGTYSAGNLSAYTTGVTSNTDTFNPDASPESTSVDGYTYASMAIGGTTFSDLRSGTGVDTQSANDSGNSASVSIYATGASYPGEFSSMGKGIVLFDTSSLPDDASISSATLSLYCTYASDTFGTQSVGITSSSPASNTALVAADYLTGVYGSTRFASDISLGTVTTSAYNDFALNASGLAAISVSGVTKFAVRLSCDIDNTSPTWGALAGASFEFGTAERGVGYKPKLSVTYTTVTGVATWTSDTAQDLNFLVYDEGAIDAWADSKAFYLAPQGQKAHLRETFTTLDASGDYPVQLGINQGTYAGFEYKDLLLSSGGAVFGSTLVIGQSVLGGIQRAELRNVWNGVRARTVKFRWRNRNANEPFTVHSYRTNHEIINKLR